MHLHMSLFKEGSGYFWGADGVPSNFSLATPWGRQWK